MNTGATLAIVLALATSTFAQDATPLAGLQSCLNAQRSSIAYLNGWGQGLSTGVASTGRKMLQTADNCAAAAAISSAIPCTPQTVPSTPTAGTPPTATASPGTSTTASGTPTGTSSSPCGDTSNPVPWTGLLCSNGQITDVLLSQLGPNIFKGQCDISTLADLAGLPALQRLDFTAAGLSGTVPASWATGAWSQSLLSLVLAQNPGITGELPDFSSFPALQSIDISSSGFTGSIPLSSEGYTSLRSFVAIDNDLTGPLPASLPANLTTLNVGVNDLNGTLPVYNSSVLSTFQVQNNSLSGCLPDAWASSLTNITNVDLSNNDFEGPIPSSWQASGSFPTLQQINLAGNDFCGSTGELGTPVAPVGQNNPNASRFPSPVSFPECTGSTCQ